MRPDWEQFKCKAFKWAEHKFNNVNKYLGLIGDLETITQIAADHVIPWARKRLEEVLAHIL